MGLTTETHEGKNVYLSIIDGKLVQKVKEGTEGAIKRTNKLGDEVHELRFTHLSGRLKNISVKKEGVPYGAELHITITDEGTDYVIQTSFSGGYAYGFLSRLPNVALSQEIKFSPYSIENAEKTKAAGKRVTDNGVAVYQRKDNEKPFSKDNSELIKGFFTKDEPNGLPPLETAKKFDGTDLLVKDKKVWLDDKRLEFFEEMLDEKFVPALASLFTPKAEKKDDFLNEIAGDEENQFERGPSADELEMINEAQAEAAEGAEKRTGKAAKAKK